MSRSRRKFPAGWGYSRTEMRSEKRQANRFVRRKTREILRNLVDPEKQDIICFSLKDSKRHWSYPYKFIWAEGPDLNDLEEIEWFISLLRK